MHTFFYTLREGHIMQHIIQRLTRLSVGLLAALLVTTAAWADPGTISEEEARLRAERVGLTVEQWRSFSENVVVAMQSDNEGLRQGALRLIIQYQGQLDTNDAVFDIMRVYRDHTDDDMRRMAVVALGTMQHRWAMGFLKRAVDFEQSPQVRHTMHAVLAVYYGPSV